MAWVDEGNMIVKDYEFKDFRSAIGFVKKVADIAEKHNHHPNILVHNYNKVRITLSTHETDSVTAKDRKLAKLIDKI